MRSRRTMQAGLTGKILPAAPLFAWLCLLALPFSPAYAAYEDLGAGARGPGMGNAMASVADDVSAAHYNPAGLGTMARPQFTAAYTQYYMGLTDGSDIGTSFFGYAHPITNGKHGTVAGALNSFSLDGGLYRENTLYLSYGRLAYTQSNGAELFMGTTLKYLYSSFGYFAEGANPTDGIQLANRGPDPLLSGNLSHKAFDADVGALYRFMTHYQLGLQVAHITQPNMAFSSTDSDPLPMAIKLGFNYTSLISNLAAQMETKKASDGSTNNVFTTAVERWFPKAFIGDFGVRGAMGIGTQEYKQLSLGLSYRTRRVQVDYGFALPLGTIAGTSGSHRMAITFHFGSPTEKEETLEILMEAMRKLKDQTVETVERSTVAVSVTPQLSKTEREIAEKLAKSEEANKARRYREAVSLASSVLSIDPKVAAAWQNMGIAYLGMNKYNEARHAWGKAYEYEKSPALKEIIRGYIKSITRLERSRASIKPKKAPPAQKPALSEQEIENLLDRGVGYYIDQDFDRAREIFERVLTAAPGNLEAQKALRRLKDEHGK